MKWVLISTDLDQNQGEMGPIKHGFTFEPCRQAQNKKKTNCWVLGLMHYSMTELLPKIKQLDLGLDVLQNFAKVIAIDD